MNVPATEAAAPADTPRPTWLLVGASGRVGRLVRAGWRRAPPAARIVPQFRSPRAGAGLLWSPLEGAEPLAALGPVDAMIVLAGVVPGRPGADFADDARIAGACLAAAAVHGVRRCLVASSSAVYGRGRGQPLDEDAEPEPATDYGRAKLATEAACAAWRGRGLDVSVLRIGNVAGADALLGPARPRGGAEIVLDRFADGAGPVRSYVDPITLAETLATLAAAESLPPVLNLAAPGEVAMADLLAAAGATWRWQPAPPTALPRLVLDCRRLAAIHAFDPDAADATRIVARWREAVA